MVATHVIRQSIFEPIAPLAICFSCLLVLNYFEFTKCASSPAVQVRFDLVNGVPARGFDEGTDVCPTLPSVDLCRAPYMKWGIADRVELQPTVFKRVDRTPANTQGRFVVKNLKTRL